jgi:tripartite-type tricarboxylate transporter receptor subunit TctC
MVIERRTALAALLGAALLPHQGWAQAFPQRPLRIIVPYAPGGLSDILARVLANGMTQRLGQPVVVENRVGANTIIGSQIVAQAAPDGYTLLLTSGAGYVANPLIYKNMPFNPQRDLRVIAVLVETPFVVVVKGGSQIQSLEDLVALGKRRRDGLNFAAVGRGNPLQLTGEMFRSAAGFEMTSIVYTGATPAHLALQTGDADFMIDVLGNSLPLIRDDKVRALAVTTRQRAALVPDVPTMVELGFPDIVAATWFGLALPRPAPEPVVTEITKAVTATTAEESFTNRFAEFGLVVQPPQDAATIEAYLAEERARWRSVIEERGLTLDSVQ